MHHTSFYPNKIMLCSSTIILYKYCSIILCQSKPDYLVLLRAHWPLSLVGGTEILHQCLQILLSQSQLPGSKQTSTLWAMNLPTLKEWPSWSALLLSTADYLRSTLWWISALKTSSAISTTQPRFQTCLLRPHFQNIRNYVCTFLKERGLGTKSLKTHLPSLFLIKLRLILTCKKTLLDSNFLHGLQMN